MKSVLLTDRVIAHCTWKAVASSGSNSVLMPCPPPTAHRPPQNRPHFLRNNQGFMPVLIAIGVVSLLAAMSLVSSMTAGMQNRKMIEKLNRMESFYSGELLAWHARERVRAGLEVSGKSVAFDNSYADQVVGIGEGGDGVPYNLVETRKYSSGNRLVRRLVSDRFIASEINKTSCGQVGFNAKKNYRVCLAESGSLSAKPVLYLSYTFMDLKTEDQFGVHLIRILDNGERDTVFGTQGDLHLLDIYHPTPFFMIRSDNNLLFQDSSGQYLFRSDGTINTSFGTSGEVKVSFGMGNRMSAQEGIALGPNDDSLMLGNSGSRQGGLAVGSITFAHSLKDGTIDSENGTLGSQYELSSDPSHSERLEDFTRHPDGYFARAIFIPSMYSGASTHHEEKLVSLNFDGRLKTAFGENGVISLPQELWFSNGSKFVVLDSGKILFATKRANGSVFLSRFNSNGTVDSLFGSLGNLDLNSSSLLNADFYFDKTHRHLGVQKVTRAQSVFLNFSRHDPDGFLDRTFGQNGTLEVEIVNFDTSRLLYPRFPRFADDGSFYFLADQPAWINASNMATPYNPQTIFLLHVSASGVLDTKFGPNGQSQFTLRSGPNTIPEFQLIR